MPRTPLTNLERLLNILVLLGSVAILIMLSVEILNDIPPYDDNFVLKAQFWICMIFLADFFVRLYGSPHRWRFFFRNILFFLVSIPYVNIFYASDLHLSHGAELAIRAIPLVRGGYGVAVVIGWMTRSRITNLFVTYTTTLFAVTYFASIIFYSLEKGVNPLITKYWDAVWWACMNVTTVGCNIFAVTPAGQILSILLAAAGLMMFPIFTAYITTRFQSRRPASVSHASS